MTTPHYLDHREASDPTAESSGDSGSLPDQASGADRDHHRVSTEISNTLLEAMTALGVDGPGALRYRLGVAERLRSVAADLADALDRLHRCIVHDARDWSLTPRDALTYALVVGWGDPDDSGESWREMAKRHGWSVADVADLKRMNAAINAHKGLHKP